MVSISPPRPRSTVTDTLEGLRISIPTKRRPFVSLFLLFWLGGWVMGEVSAIQRILESDPVDLFTVFWLGGWTIGGLFAIFALVWTLVGEEVVLVGSSTLSVAYRVLGLSRTKSYEVSHVRRVRLAPANISMSDPKAALQFWGIGGGLISFDYGASTVRFGSSIEEAEAQTLVDRIKNRIPSS